MTIKSALHKMADELNRPHWHDEIDEEDPDSTSRRGDNDDLAPADSGVTFEGTAKPTSLGGGSSKDGDNTDGNS
jgi:hypothetical protein